MRILLAAAMLAMAACEPPLDKVDRERADIHTEAMRHGMENCLKRNGIPVFSSWDGRLLDCK